MKQANLICVIGSAGSGKSTFAVALAHKLNNSLIVSYDLSSSTVKQFIPSAPTDVPSIADVLGATTINEDTFRNKISAITKNIAILGTTTKDTPTSNVNISMPILESFFETVKGLGFDNVIIDCKTDLTSDPIGLFGLETADVVYQTLTPDVKGFEWFETLKRWYVKRNLNHNFCVVNMVHKYTPITEFKKLLGGLTSYVMPFSHEVHQKFTTADEFEKYSTTDGQHFNNQLHIISEVLADGLYS